MTTLPRNTILHGDVTARLQLLPSASVDCVITSPPYFQLRDYGVPGQLGLEPTVTDWVEGQRTVMRELARVLKSSGSLWLNLGDSFSRGPRFGAPTKGLLLAPERLLVALAADGWIVRGKIIWAKPNPMPSAVADRLTSAYEVVFFLVRSPHYFFDLDAIRLPHRGPNGAAGPLAGKNPGDVWTIPTHGFREAHFATFPPALVRRPLLAGCPEMVCTVCGQPWRRQVTIHRIDEHPAASTRVGDRFVARFSGRWSTVRRIGELVPCGCGAPARPGVVLDPYFGSGTVGVVARQHGRDWLGIELNPAYAAIARRRLELEPHPPSTSQTGPTVPEAA